MRRQKWKKWVALAMATGMLVSQPEVLSVQAEEGQDTEAVTEEFREVSGEKVVTEKVEELFEGATVNEGADEISEKEIVTEVTEELSGEEAVQVSMDAFDYTIDWYNETIWITHVNQYTDETTKTVTIPATIENMPVTKIGYDAFEQGSLGWGDGE
ncbi:MAG: hypothetical protein K2K19_12465 [Acetatifactor sp.]|nr:hypothetical protein [Acetatifactor sp.]